MAKSVTGLHKALGVTLISRLAWDRGGDWREEFFRPLDNAAYNGGPAVVFSFYFYCDCVRVSPRFATLNLLR